MRQLGGGWPAVQVVCSGVGLVRSLHGALACGATGGPQARDRLCAPLLALLCAHFPPCSECKRPRHNWALSPHAQSR